MRWNPFTNEWQWSNSLDVNYLIHAKDDKSFMSWFSLLFFFLPLSFVFLYHTFSIIQFHPIIKYFPQFRMTENPFALFKKPKADPKIFHDDVVRTGFQHRLLLFPALSAYVCNSSQALQNHVEHGGGDPSGRAAPKHGRGGDILQCFESGGGDLATRWFGRSGRLPSRWKWNT